MTLKQVYKRSDVIKRKKRNNGKKYSSGSQKSLRQYLHTVTTAHTADIGNSMDQRLQLSLGVLC